MTRLTAIWILSLGLLMTRPVIAQEDTLVVSRNDSVSVRLVNADLRLAVQALARYLDRPVVFGSIGELRITLETPQPIPRTDVPDLLGAMLRTYGLELEDGGTFYRVGQQTPVAQQQHGAGPVQLFVLRVRHARAADVAATVNALYGQAAALGELGAGPPTLPQTLRQNLVPSADAAQPRPDQQAPVIQRAAQLTGDVTIIPDARTNSLLIRASQEDFDLIRAAVDQLDVRPLQVVIEVVIAEVRRDRSRGYGVETILPPHTIAGTDVEVSGAVAGAGLGDFVLQVMKLSPLDLSATLTAAASRGDVTILSRPVLLAANNETAEILVGSQRPFIQVQRALPTDAPVRDQVVQFKDVGTRLSVRPTISDDGFVTLEVVQEINAATAEVAFDAPVISTRTIQTELLVRDGHTAVLGGLADRQHETTKGGVPLLSEIPLLGGLFGFEVTRSTETELFIFLTPRVIRTDEDLEEATEAMGDKTKALRPSKEERPPQ